MKPVAPLNQADVDRTEHATAEWLSALFDGECPPDQASQALTAGQSAEGRAAWDAYRCIGDALRALAPGAQSGADPAFVRGVMQRIPAEPRPVVSVPEARHQAPAANDAVFRWKMVAGMATLAAVVAVAWQIGAVPGAGDDGPRLAQGQTPAVLATTAADTTVETPAGVVVRDPQLEELLAAHRQWGGASALQTPAGFLRAASYEPPTR